MSTISPNMGLVIPDPLITPGPAWSEELNESLGTIDAHDHSTGSGSRIPTVAININADLDFQTFNALNLRTTQYQDQVTTPVGPTDNRIVYSKNGELAYRDSLGQEVIITNNGSISGATGNISGLVSPASASYSSITDSFTFNWNTSQPGKLNISDINLYEFANAVANPITIKSPAAVASPYSFTLPLALPASDQPLMISPTGQIKYGNQVNGIGMIPISGIIGTTAAAGGYNGSIYTTVADPATGFVFCAGQTLADPLSPMNGQVIPALNDNRYLRGSSSSGSSGGSNTHNHIMSHTHSTMHADFPGGGVGNIYAKTASDPSSVSITVADTEIFDGPTLGNSTGGTRYLLASSAFATTPNAFTTGVISPPQGPNGSGAATEFATTEPQYLNVYFLMRVY